MTIQVFFRVDANENIGTGHLVRCRLLARELRTRGVHSTFLSAETHSSWLRALETEGFRLKKLSTREATNPDAVLATSSKVEDSNTLLVIDTGLPSFYKVDFQQHVRRNGLKLMMITFRHDCHFAADIVHNQNLLALDHEYSVEPYTKLLLGPRYAILADDFRRLAGKREAVSEQVRTLLISFGGTDRTNQSRKVATALAAMKEPPQRIIVVVGSLYADVDELEELLSQESNLNTELHINTMDMPNLMAQSDVAITSGGLTVWELACLGVPNVIISTSEPERATGLLLNQKQICYYLGHHNQVSEKQISNAIAMLADNQQQRRKMSWAGKQLVDGQGAQRVINHMIAVLRGQSERE